MNPHILRMCEGTFSLDETHFIIQKLASPNIMRCDHPTARMHRLVVLSLFAHCVRQFSYGKTSLFRSLQACLLLILALSLITQMVLEFRKFKIQNSISKQFIWATPCENMSSGICGQRRHRSVCTSAQSDREGLRCPQTESLDTTE